MPAGSPRCPRCQTPAATPPVRKDARPTAPHSFKAAMYSGGTSLAGGSRRPLWLGGAGAALAVILLVGIVLIRGGDDDGKAGSGGEAETAGEPAPAGTADLTRSQLPLPLPTEPARSSGQANQAARDLALALKNQRLWSTVAVAPLDSKVLIIRSSLCDDDDVQAVVSTAQGELRANGITAVRCVAAHGGVIFEKTF